MMLPSLAVTVVLLPRASIRTLPETTLPPEGLLQAGGAISSSTSASARSARQVGRFGAVEVTGIPVHHAE